MQLLHFSYIREYQNFYIDKYFTLQTSDFLVACFLLYRKYQYKEIKEKSTFSSVEKMLKQNSA